MYGGILEGRVKAGFEKPPLSDKRQAILCIDVNVKVTSEAVPTTHPPLHPSLRRRRLPFSIDQDPRPRTTCGGATPDFTKTQNGYFGIFWSEPLYIIRFAPG